MSWRSEAWRALKKYPKAKRKQTEMTDVRITPAYNGMPGGGTASRTTEEIALRQKLTPYEENIINAVEFMMKMQSDSPNGRERMRMIRLVYFQRTHTMEGAAMECHVSPATIYRWSTEILTAVYAALKK